MNPPASHPSVPAVAGLEPSMQLVRTRLDAVTMALLQTRDQIVKALDQHLAELHGLRRALAEADQWSVLNAAPAPEPSAPPIPAPVPQPPMVQNWQLEQQRMPEPVSQVNDAPLPPPPSPPPPAPVLAALQGLQDVLLHKAPITPAPMPMSEVFPDRLPDFAHESAAVPGVVPAPTPFSLRDAAASPVSMPLPVPAPSPLPSMPPPIQPIMNFQTAFTTVAPEPATPAAPEYMLPPPSSVPLSRPFPQPHLMAPPPPPVSQVMLPAPVSRSLPPPRDMAREVAADPRMEQATLEDLNAALALAFSQAAQPSRPLGQPAASIATMQAPAASRPMTQQWNLPPRH